MNKMKRIILMLFAVLLVLSIINVAVPENAKEILFRGIPWGSTYNETVSALLSDWGVRFREGEIITPRRIRSLINNSWSDYYDNECGCYTYLATGSEIKQVAGYNVENVKLYFAFAPNDQGEIDQLPENTSFFLGQYTIKPKDLYAVYEDLKQKISSLYGKPAKERSDGFIIHYKYCYWYGANDTMVVIVTDDNWDSIYINYVWNHGDDMLSLANMKMFLAGFE